MLIGGKLQFFVKEYEGDKIGKKKAIHFHITDSQFNLKVRSFAHQLCSCYDLTKIGLYRMPPYHLCSRSLKDAQTLNL